MKNLDVFIDEQQYIKLEEKFLTNVNTALYGTIQPISKITDLDAEQWFNVSKILLLHNVNLAFWAKQIAIEMAQKTMPLAVYIR